MKRQKESIKKTFALVLSLSVLFAVTACAAAPEPTVDPTVTPASEPEAEVDLQLDATQKGASGHTSEINGAVYELLDFADEQELEFAQRGLLAAPEELVITNKNGKLVWSQKAYAFVEDTEAPDTANPSLWRHTQLNHIYGLFEVVEGIYQVRGYDMSNITFIAGDTGWIVLDPLMTIECAQAALELVNETLGERPVKAVIYSHSHVDHFGGVKGIVSDEELAAGIPVIAPEGFEKHAVSENYYAGIAMGRRASYQYGTMLTPGVLGSLAIGIGMGQSTGTISYASPTDTITKTGEVRVIDGVTMEFQMTPGTEAPAEMNTWFPDFKALWVAENCTGTLHNLYTLRGAQVRDGNAWANYIMEAITLYGDEALVTFQAHNWPHWGNDVVLEYMSNTAAMYKFINDQTLLYINQGYVSEEIADMIKLPPDLEKVWYTRQYYGTVAHNAKAMYQRYMGWYDANPANLNPLPLSESAAKYVEYMGSAEEVLIKAKQDFDKGEYRWVAEITNILVFADPDNLDARYLCADALEQLGYQAESGTWRNAYLTGALELRQGMSGNANSSAISNGDMSKSIEPYMVLDSMGIHLDSNQASDINMTISLSVTGDTDYLITVKSGVLLYQKGVSAENADVSISLPRTAVGLLLAKAGLNSEHIEIQGDRAALDELYSCMAEYVVFFNIIEP